jgi:hypothetical protein
MYRTVGMAVIALAAIALPAETSLAFGPGSGAGAFGAPMGSIGPAASHVASKPGGGTASGVPSRGGGTATPQVKKLSPKGERRASAPACMGCPVQAGAISAITPATTDSSNHDDAGGRSANGASATARPRPSGCSPDGAISA